MFPRLFFPESDPFTGTLLAFSTYFVGFAARPLGGIVFGHVADRLGRKASLVATMLLMGAATVGIGLVPGYDTIGVWGGVLLVAGRTLQGIGLGGEWGGSILLAGEWTDPSRRGFAMSWPQWGGPIGRCTTCSSPPRRRSSPRRSRGSRRYSGVSLGYQLASITVGGPAPIVALYLFETFRTSTAIAAFMSASAVIGLAALSAMRDKAGELDQH